MTFAFIATALLGGFGASAEAVADAPGTSVQDDLGKAHLCVSGTHGKFARLAVLDRHRHVVKLFHLRKGCRTFRLGADLTTGTYLVKHRAPKGRLTREVTIDYLWCYPNGGCVGSGVTRDPHHAPPPAKRVKTIKFRVDRHSAVTVEFHSVKNRHH